MGNTEKREKETIAPNSGNFRASQEADRTSACYAIVAKPQLPSCATPSVNTCSSVHNGAGSFILAPLRGDWGRSNLTGVSGALTAPRITECSNGDFW